MNAQEQRRLLLLLESALALPPEEQLPWLKARCSTQELKSVSSLLYRATHRESEAELALLKLVSRAVKTHSLPS